MEASQETMVVDAGEPKIKLRSYQQEMLEASLARNIIVAMDTGSGKTPVATFRILAELERTDASKLAWFIAPKVALCDQQHEILSQHLPGYLVKKLLGSDGVDKWTDQNLWDATLANVRVIVSTPAVLADAMTHGFVHVSRLSLLVFDEAHNCIGNSPMNRIMRDFYHPAKAHLEPTPHILGLSASPVISAKSDALRKLEGSLDAVAISPKRHRMDLDAYVHPPEVISVAYSPSPKYAPDQTPRCTALAHLLQNYDIATDPYVVELRELIDSGDVKSVRSLEKVLLKYKTWCIEQLSAIWRKSTAVLEQLGPSAAEWYISECSVQFLEGEETEALIVPDVSQKERAHLASIFKSMQPSSDTGLNSFDGDPAHVTPKVRVLVDALLQHRSSISASRAVIFAEQRAVVLALGLMLKRHTKLAEHYTFGTFIGTSTSEKRKTAVADLVDLKAQSQDLKSFRGDGHLNVLVATSVLEEGIDVSACNLVICFDLPKNLVQFVQRRGRARQTGSKYIMLFSENDLGHDANKWAYLEQKMKEAYQDEQREPGSYTQDDGEQGRKYRVGSTGALLHFDNAKAHLYHFCQVSTPASKFVDVRPEFSTEQEQDHRWTATVALPPFVHSNFRAAKCLETWSKEETAIKDAAFEAYVALHEGGLVNDNLLPFTQDYGPKPGQTHVDQPSIVPVSERQSSWQMLCQMATTPDAKWHPSNIQLLHEDGTEVVNLVLYLPISKDISQSTALYWNESTRYVVEIKDARQTAVRQAANVDVAGLRSTTDYLLRSVYGSRMKSAPDSLPFLLDDEILQEVLSRQIEAGTLGAPLHPDAIPTDCGLVRVIGETDRRHFFSGLEEKGKESPDRSAILTAFPKRRDFLHPIATDQPNATAHTAKRAVPLDRCAMDALPAKYSLFAAFMPSILHQIDTVLLVADLQSCILPTVPISKQDLLIEAISSPSARETSDYNRLEFLGDSILKFCATLQVMAKHPTWPEGYLSLEKGRMVSNNSLARAAIAAGLDRYILTEAFTGAKWRPPYVDEMLRTGSNATRDMSSKWLADVVEALIGAAFVDGGLSKAHECIRVLLPAEDWIALPDCINPIIVESTQQKHIELGILERLVGHTFRKPELLIEALTHASCPYTGGGSSYERLELLGDAVLDLIIVPELFGHQRKLRHYELHRMRDALVNGDYLAYCCMQHSVDEERFDVVRDRGELGIQESKRAVLLYDFVRAGSQLMKAKRGFLEHSDPHLQEIKRRLDDDSQYPWPELVAFRPPKFFSDIIESTLGALFLDSSGDLSVCEAFVVKLGIFEEMRRILDERVETAYPKEQVGILADKERVEYVSSSHKESQGDESTTVVFDCTVRIAEEDIASCKGCWSKEEAELKAAREAIAVMEARVERSNACGKKRKLDVVMHAGHAAAGATDKDDE